MPILSTTGERIVGIDLRIDPSKAVRLRDKWGNMASWSLWPEAPFGCSADTAVWPSAFSKAEDHTPPDAIMIDASEAAYWRATTMWQDVGELTQHTIPTPYAAELIALGLENSAQEDERIARDGLMAQLCASGVSDGTAQMEARLLGIDITEELSTALFRSPRPERLRDVTIPRSAAGLIPDRDTAKSIRPHLEAADRGAPPLLIVSVWSLGEQVAT